MDDMLLEPMEQLRLRLDQLSKAVASGSSENKGIFVFFSFTLNVYKC